MPKRDRAPRGFVNLTGPAILVGLLSILHSGCSPATNQAASEQEAVEQRVDEYLAGYTSRSNFSGTVLLARGESILLNKGYGFAAVEHRVANRADTRFPIGSISKSFTAASILLLSEQEYFELDDPISRFVPDFPRGAEITIRHLLEHTSGMARIVFQSDFDDRSRRPHTPAELVSRIGKDGLVSEPGDRYGYSNANYAVLAYIVELASGVPYDRYIRTELLDPLQMNDTGHLDRVESMIGNLASGYVPVGVGELQRARLFDYSIFLGSGSMYSTTEDLFRWHRAMIAGLLPGQKPGVAPPEPPSYGWNEEERLGRKALVQRGWDGVGFAVQTLYLPEDEVFVLVLCNLSMSSIPTRIGDDLAALLLGEGYETPTPLDRPDMTPDRLAQLVGTYRFGDDFYVPGATMDLAVSNGQLVIPATPRSPEGGLLPLDNGRFIHRQQWIAVNFLHDGDGQVVGMEYGRFTAAFQPPSPATPR